MTIKEGDSISNETTQESGTSYRKFNDKHRSRIEFEGALPGDLYEEDRNFIYVYIKGVDSNSYLAGQRVQDTVELVDGFIVFDSFTEETGRHQSLLFF